MSDDGPRRSPSGVMLALGSSVRELTNLQQLVAQVATQQILARPGTAPETLAGWIAHELRNPLANAYLSIKNAGEAEGVAQSRDTINALASAIGHALSELSKPHPDLDAVTRALRVAAAALPAPNP